MAAIPMECSESKESVAARVGDHCRTRVGQPALLRKTKARSTLQRYDLFAQDLQRGRGRNGLSSALCKRAAWRERLRRGACLRIVFAHFVGKAKIGHGLSSSAGGCNASRRGQDFTRSGLRPTLETHQQITRGPAGYSRLHTSATDRVHTLLPESSLMLTCVSRGDPVRQCG